MKENKDYKEFLLEIVNDYGQTLVSILKHPEVKRSLPIVDQQNLKEKLSHLAMILAIENGLSADEAKDKLTIN